LGYHVDSIFVDGIYYGSDSSYTFSNITSDHTIYVTFAINQYTIISFAGANGTINPLGSTIVKYGDSLTFTITPNIGYHISNVIVDGNSVGATSSYTFSSIDSDHTIEAVFSINTYTITTSVEGNGSITPSGSVEVSYGGNITFIIRPDTGYHLDSVFVDGSYVDSTTSYTFYNVTANHTISAKFSIDQFTITASAGNNGSISPNGVVYVDYGSNKTFTFIPNTGYHVDSVFIDGIYQGSGISYTFTNITDNHTIYVVFAINKYTITSSVSAHGTITPLGEITVTYGDSLNFIITPEEGYHILSVIVDGNSVGAAASYTFYNISANHTISATFAVNAYTIFASADTNGMIIPSGEINVAHGSTQTFTIRPNNNYHIDSVIVDGMFVGTDSIYTFDSVSSNHTIFASFDINKVHVALQTTPPGLKIIVDDSMHSSPIEFSWAVGTTHVISALDSQYTSADVRYIYKSWSDGGAKSHTITAMNNTTFVAEFTAQYHLTMNAEPGGNVTPQSGWYDSASTITIRALPNPGYKFERWQGTGNGSYSDTGNPANITMHSPITETAYFNIYPANITIQTNPTGLSILVDDTLYTTPHIFNWLTTSSHTISVIDTQSGPTSTRFVWNNWSDGGSKTHIVTPLNDTIFTASFTTQYFLTMNANMGGTVTPSSGWYNKSQTVTITALPESQYNFTTWSGSGSGSYSGPNNPATITINSPITEIANFTRKPIQISISTNPSGRSFMYDSVLYTATQTRTVVPGVPHTIGVPSPQADSIPDKQWVWKNWNDGEPQYHLIYPNSDSTFIANFKPQFAVTIYSSPASGGTTNPSGRIFVDSGATIQINAIPNNGYIFTEWTGAIRSKQNLVSVIVTSPQVITANFGRAVNSQITTSPPGLKIRIDDTTYTAPVIKTWVQHSEHLLYAVSPQSDSEGVNHVWLNWSDDRIADTFRIFTPTTDTTISANFSTEYYLSMEAGIGGTVIPASQWLKPGDSISIIATADDGFMFNEWIGIGNGSYSGTQNPVLIIMNGPIKEYASFSRILPPPELSGIPDGANGISTSPILSWNTYAGATSYGIQVSTDSTFTDSTQFILNLNNLSDTSILLPPLANLKTYYWRVNAKVGNDITLYSSIRRFTTKTATINVSTPIMSWATGFTYKLKWNSTDLSGNVNIGISIDSGRSYHILKENILNVGITYITISDTMLSKTADSCRIRIISYLNNIIYGETDAFSIVPGTLPNSVRISTSIPFASNPTKSTEYKLFGLPGIVDTIKIGDLIIGTQRNDWRMFADNGAAENYLVELSRESKFQTGEGFWLIKKGNLDLPQYDMLMPLLNEDATYSIPLHSGWNIITNPFDKTISWDIILELNELPTETKLYSYQSAFTTSSILEPFNAYYFFNNANLNTLRVPYPFGKVYLKKKSIPTQWKVQIVFENDINKDEYNFIGISPIAKSGIDELDGYKPPLFLDQGFLYFPRREWNQEYYRFNSDFRQTLGEGQVWDFETSNPRMSNCTIHFIGIEQIPDEYQVVLLNLLNYIPINLRTTNEYSFQSVTKIMKFKIIVGNNEFIDNEIKKLLPTSYELVQNFPNPFNSSTSISIKLPKNSNVKLEIYNTIGQRVKTLFRGELPAGIHTFNWDGKDDNQQPIATGVYLYRFADGENIIQTKKMLLIK